LDLSANTELTKLYCYWNRLPLSDLFAASERISEQENKRLGEQNLLPQTVIIDNEIDYSNQNIFNGIYTQFAVTKNYHPAPESDYTLTGGKIRFHCSGNYTVTMKNEAIISNESYPARVIVDIEVVETLKI